MKDDLGFIHAFLPGTSPRTLLLLHGTGADEQDILPVGRALDAGANLLSPRGKVNEEGRLRFFARFAEGVFDLEDLAVRTDELADFIVAAAAHYQLDREEMIAAGYSNGANISASILLRHPGLLRRAILFRAMVPFVPEKLPDLGSTRVWISAGKTDTLIPARETERIAALLRDCGANVTLERVNSDHTLTMEDITLAQAWLAHGAS
jgi:phospholipase/carboxylesterase